MVGANIKHAREMRNLTQEALAEQLNVTRQAISNWENDKTKPDIDTLHQIAQILDVSIEVLVYGIERKPTVEKHIHIEKHLSEGVTIGAVLAIVISYVKWKSIGWAMLHGFLGWFYVIYYIIEYGWS